MSVKKWEVKKWEAVSGYLLLAGAIWVGFVFAQSGWKPALIEFVKIFSVYSVGYITGGASAKASFTGKLAKAFVELGTISTKRIIEKLNQGPWHNYNKEQVEAAVRDTKAIIKTELDALSMVISHLE